MLYVEVWQGRQEMVNCPEGADPWICINQDVYYLGTCTGHCSLASCSRVSYT